MINESIKKFIKSSIPEVQIDLLLYTTPIIVARTKTNKFKYWLGLVLEDVDSNIVTRTIYFQSSINYDFDHLAKHNLWYIKDDCKITLSEATIVESKNIGKSNETSLIDQAISEIDSKQRLKIDKGYVVSGSNSTANVPLLPMLAQSFEKKSHVIDWNSPVYVQPKLDGVRCLLTSDKTITRGGKEFIPEVFNNLSFLASKLGDTVLDGELILIQEGEMMLLQDTVKAVKKYRPELTNSVVYVVYDIVAPTKTFSERLALLESFRNLENSKFKLCHTEKVTNIEDIEKLHDSFFSENYEGAMIRPDKVTNSNDNYYLPGKRSSALLKLKNFMEEEFRLIQVNEGKGKFKGQAVFTLSTIEGNTFEAVPIGSVAERAEYFEKRENYENKYWTVRFQGYTKDNIPLFPRAICCRDYE